MPSRPAIPMRIPSVSPEKRNDQRSSLSSRLEDRPRDYQQRDVGRQVSRKALADMTLEAQQQGEPQAQRRRRPVEGQKQGRPEQRRPEQAAPFQPLLEGAPGRHRTHYVRIIPQMRLFLVILYLSRTHDDGYPTIEPPPVEAVAWRPGRAPFASGHQPHQHYGPGRDLGDCEAEPSPRPVHPQDGGERRPGRESQRRAA